MLLPVAYRPAKLSAGLRLSQTVEPASRRPCVACARQDGPKESRTKGVNTVESGNFGLGDGLGPIGMTIGGSTKSQADRAGDLLGPISLSFSEGDSEFDGDSQYEGLTDAQLREIVKEEKKASKSIHEMSTAAWREKYEADGVVSLWVEEEFNSGSRLKGGRGAFKGETYGTGSGEGPSLGQAPVHHVKIFDHRNDQVVDVDVPEDRYILWEAEDAGLELPNACRMGCCTVCAVRVKEGKVWQPEALGISRALKDEGFALMCVGYPTTDVVLETVDEDEIYDMQFGKPFADLATNKGGGSILRDDFALELAEMDE